MITDLQTTAEAIAPSDLLPAAYRGRPANVLVAAHLGARYGWDPATSCQLIAVVDGKPTLSGGAMLGLIRQAGHSVTIDHRDGECIVSGKRADNGDSQEVSFTMDEAQKAGLAKRKAWLQYPQDMLQWRAVSRLARGLFSDVLLGVRWLPDEIEAVDDEQMRTLDPTPPPQLKPAEDVMTLTVVADDDEVMPPAKWKAIVLAAACEDKDAARAAVAAWEHDHGPAGALTDFQVDDIIDLIDTSKHPAGTEPF